MMDRPQHNPYPDKQNHLALFPEVGPVPRNPPNPKQPQDLPHAERLTRRNLRFFRQSHQTEMEGNRIRGSCCL